MTRIGREERSSFPSPLEGEGAEQALTSEAGEGFARKRAAKEYPFPGSCALLLATRLPLPHRGGGIAISAKVGRSVVMAQTPEAGGSREPARVFWQQFWRFPRCCHPGTYSRRLRG